jgi:glycosyltransferase involved in cell wall biosynthesis
VYGKKEYIEITIIIPIHEEQIIPELYNRLQNTVSQISKNYELIFVNDGPFSTGINKTI